MGAETNSVNFFSTTFRVFHACSALLLLKMLLMALLVARQRLTKKVVPSQEDTYLVKGMKVKFNDPDVERVRRAHMNDLENILMFISAASLYCASGPNPLIAVPLLVAFTISRFIHTFVYAVKVKDQPARAIAFSIGFIITAFMASSVAFSLRDSM